MIDSRDNLKTEKKNSLSVASDQPNRATDIPSNNSIILQLPHSDSRHLQTSIDSLEKQGFGIDLQNSELSQFIQMTGGLSTQRSCSLVLNRLATGNIDIKFPTNFDPS